MKIARGVLASVAAILAGVPLPVRALTVGNHFTGSSFEAALSRYRESPGNGRNPQPAGEDAKHSFTIAANETASVTPNALLASSLQADSRGL